MLPETLKKEGKFSLSLQSCENNACSHLRPTPLGQLFHVAAATRSDYSPKDQRRLFQISFVKITGLFLCASV